MAENAKLLGCILNSEGNWVPTGNAQRILKAELDALVIGDTLLECQAALEQRFPADDLRLTRVFVHKGYRSYGERNSLPSSDCSFNDSDYFSVRNAEEQCYAGGDAEEALALVRKHGIITVAPGTIRLNDRDWGEEGCVVTPSGRHWEMYVLSLRYSPKAVRSARKASVTRKKRQAVLANDIATCTWGLYKHVREFLPLPYENEGTYSRYSVCCNLMHAIKWFNFCFGKKAHRRHAAFQKLKANWRQRQKATDKAYRGASKEYQDLRSMTVKLCNFMEEELTKRNAPLNNTSQWKPLREPEDFYEYADATFEEKRKERETQASKSTSRSKSRSTEKR